MPAGIPHRQTDPVRHIFEVDEGLFNLGGRQEPVAIRDQVLRACLVVDRAAAAGLIGPHGRVAIIGAGVAGVAAALRALDRHGARVALFDEAHQPLLARPYVCRTRWIDPTLYDWPAPHWTAGRCQLPGAPEVSLDWEANTAVRAAARWRRVWGLRAAAPLELGLLSFQPQAQIVACRRGEGGYFLADAAATLPPERSGPFAAVIAACGRGQERTWLGRGERPSDYAGYRFWQDDPVEEWNYGLGGRGVPLRPTILISGGGDGALQDLLRATFRRPGRASDDGGDPFSPGELLRALARAVAVAAGPWLWDRLIRQIAAAEERVHRASPWVQHDGERYADAQDAAILSRLDADYDAAIGDLLADPRAGQAARDTLGEWGRPDLGDIHLIAHHGHLSQCYPLNRLFGRLLLALGTPTEPGAVTWLAPAGGAVTFWLGASIAALRPLDHRCEPWRCCREPHQVDLEGANGRPLTSHRADLVLIRHGLIDHPPIEGIPAVALGRQHLPYELPE